VDKNAFCVQQHECYVLLQMFNPVLNRTVKLGNLV